MRLRSIMAAVAVAVAIMELSMSAAASDNGSRWFSFAEYPQARRLCHEHVLGHGGGRRMEIEWQSFAVSDPPEKVAAFYERDQKTRAEKDEHDGYHITAPGAPRDKMSIFPPSQATHHPSCSKKAKSSERTVILVSRLVGG
jgi:hypothetical protein